MTDREKFESFYQGVSLEIRQLGFKDSEIEIRKQSAWLIWQAALTSQQPADDGWIEWKGGKFNCGEIPVSDDTPVEVKTRKGLSQGLAGWLRWYHSGGDNDIIAYRVVKP